MERYTPEQMADKEKRTEEVLEKAATWLTEKMKDLGLEEVSDISAFALSPEEKKQMRYARWYSKEEKDAQLVQRRNARLFMGTRSDGELVRIAVKPLGTEQMLFAADIFSSSFSSGYAGNNDCSGDDLEENMKRAFQNTSSKKK